MSAAAIRAAIAIENAKLLNGEQEQRELAEVITGLRPATEGKVTLNGNDVTRASPGQIMESGATDEVFSPPYHPYTEALLSAVPIPDPTAKQKQIRLEGSVPSAGASSARAARLS